MSCAEQIMLAACFMLVSYLAYSWTLKLEAICCSEKCVRFHWTTGRYIVEERSPQLQQN
jgi:hypothetical protein